MPVSPSRMSKETAATVDKKVHVIDKTTGNYFHTIQNSPPQ